MATTKEGLVKNAVRALLKNYSAKLWWFMPVSIGLGKHGVPDFVCCVDGKTFTIETKAPGKKPTALQEKCMKEIRDAGGATFVVSCGVGLMEVKQFIEGVLDGKQGKGTKRVSSAKSGSNVEDIRFWSDPVSAG